MIFHPPKKLFESSSVMIDLELLENLASVAYPYSVFPATNVDRHRKLSPHNQPFPPLRLVYWQSHKFSTIPEDALEQKNDESGNSEPSARSADP